ncbi:hypothetical protein KP509_20G068700 [Ceratopteris richardii]|uniref:EF-hand domain-containing protein n=1 Tax=Ceratopteris richardii TaxID=49495 RepID=A0A8T2SGV9_CERRI|nr:hypothetical protein KP509_20G068700 [Ceratopteris richardii]KAH7332109.1 hypothetical protein KP509_20G068700 [Ceratopteris richardii]
MGCFSSKPSKLLPGCDNPADLALGTSFSVNEVEALYELFKQISSSLINDGLIHKEEFQLALSANRQGVNFFAERVFDLFDSKKDGVLEFAEFVKGLSVFHPNTPKEEKVDFAFKIYDIKHMGHIGREEVKLMLIALLSESDMHLSDDMIESILEKTFVDADKNGDGKIDRDDWRDFVCRNPALIKMMTLPYLKEITTTFPSFIFHSKVDDLCT